MVSVENFYWVLYENLLKPAGLDCWYYLPWDHNANLTRSEFKPLQDRRDFNHVFFHFDQEPLWSTRLGMYDSVAVAWAEKYAKILANSEHSDLKKKLCKSRGLLDWYFFYHGFAALHWYRDAKWVDHDNLIQNAFLSMNHMLDGRSYRLALLGRFLDRAIINKGSISFHSTIDEIYSELNNPNSQLSEVSRDLVQHNVKDLAGLPWILDQVPIDGNLSARFGHQEYKLWQNSLWHVVNETVFYESKLHLTEKVFKPIVSLRPFVLVSTPGSLKYLKSYGFKTFDNWIDERYDDIYDADQRLDAICMEIERYARMSTKQLRAVSADMMQVLQYNKNHFFGDFQHIIVDELVENFQQCLRIWNNGRIDGRELPLLKDGDAVKTALLR
jgi:hypothetical protein